MEDMKMEPLGIRVIKFEEREKLFERTYLGYPYWQDIRERVFRLYTNQRPNMDISDKVTFKKIKIGLMCVLYSIMRTFFPCKFDQCDVLFMDNVLNKESKFLDYWELPKSISYIKIKPFLLQASFSFGKDNALMIPYLKYLVRYILKNKLPFIKKDNTEFQFLIELERKIKKEFGFAYSACAMEQLILKAILMDDVFGKYYEKLFEKLKCKAMVVICYYSDVLYPAYRAARKRGVRIIELQHGVINFHRAYWFEDRRGINNNVTPDYLLAFGRRHILNTKLMPSTRALPIGFPYQEKKVQEVSSVKTEKNTIIIYPTQEKEFELVINEFVNIIFPKGYRIIMKIHPLQLDDFDLRYPILSKNNNLEIVASNDKSIYYWLKLGSYHIVANTTVGLEAIAFNHTNICVAEHVEHSANQQLLDCGLARGFSTAEELVGLIENRVEMNADSIRDEFWEKNAAENMKKFFMQMQQQNWPSGLEYKE